MWTALGEVHEVGGGGVLKTGEGEVGGCESDEGCEDDGEDGGDVEEVEAEAEYCHHDE